MNISKKNLYIFSGLGADERVFQKLIFSDHNTTYVKWILPEPNEPIEKYASRLVVQIKANNPIFIGLSFGGIMAVEVAKLIHTEKIIAIPPQNIKMKSPSTSD